MTCITSSVTLQVIEPHINITKTATPMSSYLQAGSVVEYTVTLSHTTASAAPAFAIWITDFSTSFTVASGSVAIALNGATMSVSGYTATVNSTGLVMEIYTFPLNSGSIVIQYNVTLANTVDASMR